MDRITIPPSLPAAHELPLATPPDIPLWSENYCLQAYDPGADHGVWLHLGLPVYDGGLWHDITVVYLPGGEDLLIAKSFAPRDPQRETSSAGAMLHADYDAASGEWRWRFHGAAHRAKRSELHRALMQETIAEPLRFDLNFRGLSRVWDQTRYVGEQVWSTDGAHWEQPCATTGWIEYGGRRIDFNGSGVRDHTRGKRDTTHFGPHYWLHGAFPSGRCFGLLYVAGMPGQPVTLNRAYVVYDGELQDAEVLLLPADRGFSAPFEIVLRDGRGTHRICGELLHDMTFSFLAPNEMLFGRDNARAERFLNEGQVRWSWNGETGYGLGERTVRIGPDRRPDDASVKPVMLG